MWSPTLLIKVKTFSIASAPGVYQLLAVQAVLGIMGNFYCLVEKQQYETEF